MAEDGQKNTASREESVVGRRTECPPSESPEADLLCFPFCRPILLFVRVGLGLTAVMIAVPSFALALYLVPLFLLRGVE